MTESITPAREVFRHFPVALIVLFYVLAVMAMAVAGRGLWLLLYGCDNRDFIPNRDAITDLWKGLKGLGANFIGTTHMTFSAVAADPELMRQISRINKQDETGRWLATNLGIETVAPKMVKKHLGVKTRPFAPEEWGSRSKRGG